MKLKLLFTSIFSKKHFLFFLICLILSANIINAQIPTGTQLLSKDINAYQPFGFDKTNSPVQEVTVTGQSFSKALRVNNTNQQNLANEMGITFPLSTSVKKGDVIWLTFQARCIKSTRESGEALIEVRLDQLVDGKYQWPSYMDRGLSIGNDWVETSIPFKITDLFQGKKNSDEITPKDVRFVIRFDKYPQIIEIGPVTLLNCGQTVSINDLPRTVVKYDGDAPDAPWRKEAADRIEKIRKGDLALTVVDKNGKKISNADVAVHMTCNAFNWGTATNSNLLLNNNPDAKIYRDTLLRYFNHIVYENELKWKIWNNSNANFDNTFKSLRWLQEKNISARGHVMVWPSWKNSPRGLDSLKNDTAALRKAILSEIQFITNKFRGQFKEWDVINEVTFHHDFMDLLGKSVMIDWFKEARKADPNVKLFLNEFTMFHNEENNREGLNSNIFYNTTKFLVENNAPIDAIGEQAHIGGTPPGIPFVLSRLDKFSVFKLPIQISEFDIYSNDEDFKAHYIGDFMTAIYSHPSTIGFVQWGFWEGSHWLPIASLWNKDWTIRKSGKVYTDLVTKTWWTNFDGKTSANGECKLRGFCGDYEITVTYKGKSVTQKYTLDNKGGKLVVKLQ